MDKFLGQIFLFAGSFIPAGSAACDGSSYSINDYSGLYALIGSTYGGDSQTFKVPDLRGRVPVHVGQLSGGSNYPLGQNGGTENVTLTVAQLATHSHFAMCSAAAGNVSTPQGNVLAAATARTGTAPFLYTADLADNQMGAATGQAGFSQPFSRLQPLLALNYCIVIEGIFPPRP